MGNDHSPSILLDAIGSLPSVQMDDSPTVALRKKKNASMFVGLRMLKMGQLDAFVSAGNSGALVLGSKLILSALPGITRPAFLSYVPAKKHPVAVLDLGANIQCKAEHLVQFALMATAYVQTMGTTNPKIGLLNIGEEPIKGTSELRLAYHLLQTFENPPFKFAGNIEGKSVFDGDVDALVTDGFTGNIFLKTAEGMASLILDQMPKDSQSAHLKKTLHYAAYPGAILLGVKGLVVKCHGYSSIEAILNAVRGTVDRVKKDFTKNFQNSLGNAKLVL
jgi:phosphate acyltransferase